MLQVTKQDEGRKVELKGAPVTPRTFSVRDADGNVIEGATGSVGYGLYAPIIIDGLRHQLTMNIVVNGSKKWTDADKLAWIDGHSYGVEVDVTGYADTFRNAKNTGWRLNTQLLVVGQACTVSGSLVLSGKTVKAEGEKAKRNAEREARATAAVQKHEAALAKAREAREKAIAALKGA